MEEKQITDFEYFEKEFIVFLKRRKSSERTIDNRLHTMRKFFNDYKVLNEDNYCEYYEFIVDNNKPATINSKTITINLYINFLEEKYNIKIDWKQKSVQVKRVQFLDDIISLEQYLFFLNKAKARGKDKIFIACKIMGTTGMRLHELLNIRREHIEIGFIDFYGKGNKERRVYFTEQVKKEVLDILDKNGVGKDNYVISKDWDGKQQNWKQLRSLQRSIATFSENECEFEKGLIHPHMFRHFFAKNFIKKYQNIALLADLLGHSNIETTRIYLKYTSKEQQEIVNEVVTW